jgi:hypothetical protein
VRTRYSFPGGAGNDTIDIERTFEFGSTPFSMPFRPYVPRLLFNDFPRVIHPDAAGTALLEGGGPDWDGSWFALTASTGTFAGQGVIVRRQSSAFAVSLWLDDDAFSNSNATSALLSPPAGGFTGTVRERELLCFFDATSWPPSAQAALTLPAGCAFDVTCEGGSSGGSGGSGGAGGGGGTSGGTGGASAGSGGVVTGGSGDGGPSAGSGGTGGSDANGGTGGSTGPGAGGTSGAGGGTETCMRVSPIGDDLAAEASLGATAFGTVQRAIDFAAVHTEVASRVCIASGTTCGSTWAFNGPNGADLTMRNGISVFGRYESSTWQRCDDSVTQLAPTTGKGIVFGEEISLNTELNGVVVRSAAVVETAGVTVAGARGARLVDVSMPAPLSGDAVPADVAYGARIGAGSEVVIEHSTLVAQPGNRSSVGLLAESSRVTLSDSIVNARGMAAIGMEIHDAADVSFHGGVISVFSAPGDVFATAVHALGDLKRLVIEDATIAAMNSFVGKGDQDVTGVRCDLAGNTGVELRRNQIRVDGARNVTGVVLTGGSATVDSNLVECNGLSNESGFGEAVGIRCNAGACRELSGNTVTGPNCAGRCAYDMFGIDVVGAGTLIDSNRVQAGCSSAVAWTSAVGLRVAGDVRAENNFLVGAACGTPGQGAKGYGVIVEPGQGSVVLHSNYIDAGGASAAGCATAGVWLEAGDAVLRNNIIVPGTCPTAFNIDQTDTLAAPHLLENNAFVPGPSSAALYRIGGMPELKTIGEVNALPDSAANFSAFCSFPLVTSSECVDAGTSADAPDHDIDGAPRSDGAWDVGPDELASCQHYEPVQLLSPSDGGPLNVSNVALAIDGDHALMGTVWDDDEESVKHMGVVYAFTGNGSLWTETQKLMAPDAVPLDYFGCSVAADGGLALVGAMASPHGANVAGAAYAYERSGNAWTYKQTLLAPGPPRSIQFGLSTALHGEVAAVGALDGAYVFRRSGGVWALEQSIPSDGWPVLALQGDRLLVSGCPAGQAPSCSSLATVYEHSSAGWNQEQLLIPSDATDRTGYAVALAGDRVFAGALSVNGSRGRVYVFERSNAAWRERQIIDVHGGSLAASSTRLVVAGADQAFSYMPIGDTWQLEQSLLPAVPGSVGARAVALSERMIFVAASSWHSGREFVTTTVFEPCGR